MDDRFNKKNVKSSLTQKLRRIKSIFAEKSGGNWVFLEEKFKIFVFTKI